MTERSRPATLAGASSGAKVGRTVVIADDLSGAAECAAEFAQPGVPILLQLAQNPDLGDGPAVVWDVDARDATPTLLPEMVRTINCSRRAYVKIDSLLRGNWAALVAAIVQKTPRPTVMCSALPRLGRSMREGFVDLAPIGTASGQGLAHYASSAIEELALAGVQAGHYLLSTGTDSDIREGLLAALGRNTVTVIDARTDAELDTLARALESLPTPYTAIGSAGLAGALARVLTVPLSRCALGTMSSMAILVGSRTGPAREQLAQLATESGEAVCWWSGSPGGGIAPAAGARDRSLHLFSTCLEASATPGGRHLTRRFVDEVLTNLPAVDCFVTTGGETARALCDALGVAYLTVLGQVEPGVSLARMALPGGPRHLVLKSGSFGDPETLVRVARLGGLLPAESTERNS